MARITLTSGFKRIPEGQHIFYVYDCKYDETFGQLDLYLYSESTGDTHCEKFFFITKAGEANEGALNAFSYLAKVILDDFEVEDIDPEDLIGHRFIAEIVYQEGEKNGQKRTYAHIGDKMTYDGRAVAYLWDTSDFARNWYEKQNRVKEEPATPAQKPETPAEPAQETPGSVDDMLAALGL